MLFVVWVPLCLQLFAPVGLVLWLALGHPTSRFAWVMRTGLTVLYIALIAAAGLWLVLPWYAPAVYAAVLALAALASARRLSDAPRWPTGRRAWLGAAILAAAVVACGTLYGRVVLARQAPANAFDLSFPLRGGPFLVVNGGGSELINAHLKTLAGERFRRWRGQSFGVDITRLGAAGFRARGILPRDPAAYQIYGDTVHAPCAGTVLAAADGAPEMSPPKMDRGSMAGNHVILRCGEVWVVLAHLRRGSVSVRAGESLAAGRPLGLVGNSGNTGEPHLHIHAQRAGTRDEPLSGDPLAIRFGDIYPTRNVRIRSPGGSNVARAGPSAKATSRRLHYSFIVVGVPCGTREPHGSSGGTGATLDRRRIDHHGS